VRFRTLALVESATQLINAAEWAHDSGEDGTTNIVVLAPTDPESVRQIHGVAAAARASGLPVVVLPVRAKRPAAPLFGARVLAAVARAGQLVVGDPFSRYIHALLPAAHADQVVIVDDGTATWDYAACIESGAPLERWTRPSADPRPNAIRATRLLTPSPRRSIDVFTCLRDATPVGAVGLANRYRWIRSQSVPEVIDDQIDVLGTSLVDSGVVDRHAYLNAVATVARSGAPVRYVAHRREASHLVAEIATIDNVRVVRPDRPVEMLLRQGPVARELIAFPSTAAHTLPVVLSDLDVRLRVQPIAPGWFTAAATLRARSFVARIAHDAPVPSRARLG
jgi:hypothetical protein